MTCAGLLLGACSSDVRVDLPRPADDVRRLCGALHAALPATLDGHERRDVTPDDPLAAAWGDPAMVLRCGVGEPPLDLSGENADVALDGVDWRPVKESEGYVFTLVGRAAYVEVRVPDDYAPEVNPLIDLAPAVKRTLPVR